MEKNNDKTLLLLLAAGFGIYWLTRKKAVKDQISTQPVIEQPISVTPVADQVSTQPVYEQPVYAAPIVEQPVQSVEYTPKTDMFNTVMQTNYVDKTPFYAVYNMIIKPL